MFQIHVIDRSNRTAYAAELEQHFRIRHQIYIAERGWRDLARLDGRELDAFDNDDAVYLLGLLRGGGVVAGSRLVPSMKPHLMRDVFPQLAPRGVPRADDIFEWTRIFVVPALREPGRPCLAAGIVYSGIVEFCLLQGVRWLSVVCETYWIDRLRGLGWNPQPLGEPIEHRGEMIVGLINDMTLAALEKTRGVYGLNEPVLFTGSQEFQLSRNL